MSSVFFVNTPNEGEAESSDSTAQNSSNSGAQSEAQIALNQFWNKVTDEIRKIGTLDLKTQALPLARIKKIMKLDDDVKMISAEAPMLFAKAAEIFIHELTLRAWIHTEDNKRRTLQRNDIAMAITKFDQFDFLIDIVPRDEVKTNKTRDEGSVRTASMNPDQVHYYFQLAQQHQAALQQTNQQPAATPAQSTTVPTIQIVQPQQVQTVSVASSEAAASNQNGQQQVQQVAVSQGQHGTQVIQIQQPAPQSQPQPQQQQQQSPSIQIVQQIVSPTGEIQHVPIQLTPQQMQMIRMQMQSGTNQPVIIQAQPIQQNSQQQQIIQVAQQTSGGAPVYLTQATTNAGQENE